MATSIPKMYDLRPAGIPADKRNPLGGKAKVAIGDDGSETLISFVTPIIRREADGSLVRLYHDDELLTVTTLKHIKVFCGLDKKGFLALP